MSTAEEIEFRRDRLLRSLTEGVAMASFLGVAFDRRGDELTATLPYDGKLIGNPFIPALHGGVTAAFLEMTAIIELTWKSVWQELGEEQGLRQADNQSIMPKTISFSVDYLRPGMPRDSYARATVTRSGRRYASVHVEGWQDRRSRLFAEANGQFLMPGAHE